MRRRLAIWMLNRALKMEPLLAIGIQQAADENACARLRQALAEAEQADAQAQRQAQYQASVSRIASSN